MLFTAVFFDECVSHSLREVNVERPTLVDVTDFVSDQIEFGSTEAVGSSSNLRSFANRSKEVVNFRTELR